MLQGLGGTAQTDGSVCRGRGLGRNKGQTDRKGYGKCQSLVKQNWSVHLSD